jgi:hypothetical protein
MASPLSKLGAFLKSPRGRKLTEQAKSYARDPRNREKAKDMFNKFRGGKGGSGRH